MGSRSGYRVRMVARRRTRAPLALFAAGLLAVPACTSASDPAATPTPTPTASSGADPTPSEDTDTGGDCVVAAAGDVADEDFRDGAALTGELISSAQPEKVLALGDLAYEDGTAAQFADYYEPSWGHFKDITAPAPGNHEYHSDGKGYFDYFDVPPNYAFDVCGWHVVSVDQYADLDAAITFIEEEGAAAGDAPLLVFWHEPRFSSGSRHGSDPDEQPLWEAAVAAGAEIVLNGHDHHYERFEPLDADGNPDPDGTVQFVSGNGGHELRDVGELEDHSAATVTGTPGVLFLSLWDDGYSWRYEDVEGRIGDSGTRSLS